MNERDKIIEITKVEFDIQFGCGDCIEIGDKEAFAENLVDALFKAGIGDVAEWKEKVEQATSREKFEETERKYADKRENECRNRIKVIEQERDEWKRRAEVAERALEYAVSEYRCDECPCFECNAEIRGSQDCVDLIAKTYKKQVEHEIEEEKSNGEKKKV